MSGKPSAVLGLDLERFRYAGAANDALSGIRLLLEPGSLTAIVGDSGSGKSTLGAVLAGMLPRHHGDELEASFSLGGELIRHGAGAPVRINPVGWARQVGMLPQDARHYLSGVRETVQEELALGLENAGVPREEILLRIGVLTERLGLRALLYRDPGCLSGGQERLVALAALALEAAPVVVLDEPLAGLDAEAAAHVCDVVSLLRAAGTAVVLLTGAFDALGAEASEVLKLHNGSCHAMDTATWRPPDPYTSSAHPPPGEKADLLLEFCGVELGYSGSAGPVVSGFDLELRAGECLALAGPNGSGKTTVLKAAAGLLRPRAGTLRGPSLTNNSVGLLLQNSADQLFERSVRREVTFGLSRRDKRAARVPEVLESLGLAAAANTHPYELPASARRLVALATVLVREPRVLVLDEPTEALDTHAVARLRRSIAAVLDSGGAVLLATHDEAFMAGTAHRVQQLAGAGATPVHD